MCPVCRIKRTIPVQLEYGDPLVRVPQFLYQRSYKGKPGYISPRCEKCFDKAMKRYGRAEREMSVCSL